MKTFLLKPLCVVASLLFASFTYSQTVTVSKCNMNGWHALKNNGNNDAFLDLDPNSAPGAPGSGRLKVGKNGDTYASFTTGNNYKQSLLSSITELKYSTFVQQNGGKNLAPFISLDVDYDGDASAEDTWIFEPASQSTPVVLNTWQTWNALSGKWYSAKGLLRSGPGAKATTLTALIQAKPSARLLNAHTIKFMAGTKKNAWEDFDGNIDNVIIGVSNQSTTFDLVCNNSGAPSIVCPAAVMAYTQGFCGANLTIAPPTASDACGNPITAITSVRSDGAPLTASYPKGETTITWTATDGSGATISCTQAITVVDNEVPVITCRALASNERNTDPGVCSYTIVGSEMDAQASDNCGATLTYELTGATTGSGGSTLAGVVLNKGVTTITWSATDGTNTPVTCHFDITVIDNQPPVFSEISASPNILWSPNHKMVDVYLDYTVTDNCGGIIVPEIFMISSDEDENGLGDGNTEADWEIVDAHHVRLRAERSGLGDGRVYTIKIRAQDYGGLAAYGTATVAVPHDQSSPAQETSLEVVYAPNPSSNSFILTVNSANTTDKVSITVSNSTGNVVYRNTNFAAGETINFGSSFPKGTYYAEIKQAGKTKHVTLLKI
jgi:hypothetical protein